MTEPTSAPEKIQNQLWIAKLVIAFLWTSACGLLWLMMILLMAAHQPSPGISAETSNAALGMAAVMATGCVGGVWLLGSVVLLVIYALVRR